ncbi:MAG: phosphotransferase [Acidimicrobiia bacterium]|nr:phosphotransferase [Acidimicrobiia bacterium]
MAKTTRQWMARRRNLTERQYLALAAVRAAERAETSLPQSRRAVRLLALDRVMRRPQLDDRLEVIIPAPLRLAWHGPDVQEVRAGVAADAVVIGKFDIRDSVRLRAAYADEGVTLAIQPPRPDSWSGIARAVEAHGIVDRHAPGLMPRLLGHGVVRDELPYLVEAWVDGHPLISAESLDEAASEILEAIGSIHRGYGVTRVPVGECWGGGLVHRWAETVEILSPDLATVATDMISRDHTLRCSRSHGDMVASNILRTGDGIVLVDWENASVAPIMRDAAKLHLYSATPEKTLRLIIEAMGEATPARAYTPREELALVHAQLLSLNSRRRAELEGHPRSDVYKEQARRQVVRMREALQLGA